MMNKWKCDICKKEFDNFHAQGFDNKIYCPLCFFKEENIRLQQRIDKAIEYIRKNDALYEFKIDMSPEAIPNSVVVDDYKCRKELIEILGGKE